MVKVSNDTRILDGCTPDTLPLDELLSFGRPTVLRGIARRWGLVEAGLSSVDDAMSYLRSFYNGKVLSASFAAPQADGRLFYNDDFTRLNFEARRTKLGDVLDEIRTHLDDELAPTVYIGSTLIDSYLPGLRKENDLGFAEFGVDAPPAIWIGNRTIASCHYDAPNNIACVAVGRRRFTMFPPSQVENLYPGPLELNPGGQAVSLVDFRNPDFAKFPRFRAALEAGYSATLEPGDAIFVPSMWWHHVEGLSPFNTLVNYWWSSVAETRSESNEFALSRDLVDSRQARARRRKPGDRFSSITCSVRRRARVNTCPSRREACSDPSTRRARVRSGRCSSTA